MFWQKKNHSVKRLAQKTSSGAERLGTKAYENVEKVGTHAGTIESIAGKISGAAGTGATLAALSGFGVPVAAALGSVSAAAGGVAKVAGLVKGGAEKGAQAKSVYERAMRFMG